MGCLLFAADAPRLWNRLRSDICTVTDEALLKSNLKTHLLGTALNTYRRCDISLQFL